MEKAIRHIGVFTSEGDTPGMNATIRAVVRTSLHMGIKRVGIRRGYHGLVNGDFTKLTFGNVSDLSHRGDTILYLTRSEEFKTSVGQERAVATRKVLGLDALVDTGGDGISNDLFYLAKGRLSVVGILGTIDNDVACSGYTIGYDAVCNTTLESIDKLRDIMQSHERCPTVKVMSHRVGHLALTIGVACSVVAVIVPEHPVDYEADLLEPIRWARLAGRTHFMVVVAEGVESGVYSIDKVIEGATVLDTRITVLGYIRRGGSPSSRDQATAAYMGYGAVRLPAEGKTCRVVVLQGGNYVDYDITEALQTTKSLDQRTYEVMHALAGVH